MAQGAGGKAQARAGEDAWRKVRAERRGWKARRRAGLARAGNRRQRGRELAAGGVGPNGNGVELLGGISCGVAEEWEMSASLALGRVCGGTAGVTPSPGGHETAGHGLRGTGLRGMRRRDCGIWAPGNWARNLGRGGNHWGLR